MKRMFNDFYLIDLKNGTTISDLTLIVENDRFIELTYSQCEGESTSLHGSFVLPGLIDAHVHLTCGGQTNSREILRSESPVMMAYRAAQNAQRNLSSGITTVRDVGGPDNIPIELAKAVKNKIVPGCRIFSAGAAITQTGGHGAAMGREADGRPEIRKAVREQIKAGADFIKLICSGEASPGEESIRMMQLSQEEIQIAVQTAKAANKKTAAHALPEIAIKACLEAGVDSIEHAALADEKNLTMFTRTGTFMVPTLAPYHARATRTAEIGTSTASVNKSQQVMRYYRALLKKAVAVGVNMALGSNAGVALLPHPALPYEAWLWQAEAGIEPLRILQAATIGGAKVLGRENELGQIQQGFCADFVTYAQNPLENIAELHYPQMVFQSGLKVAEAHVVWSAVLLKKGIGA